MTSERIVRNPEPSLAISARLCDRQARGFVRAHPVKVHKERTARSRPCISRSSGPTSMAAAGHAGSPRSRGPIPHWGLVIKGVHLSELRTAVRAP